MKKILFIVAAVAVLGTAVPAGAQVFIGADSGGAGVQFGPIGAGIGPRFSDDGYYRHSGYGANAYYDGNARYGRHCRMIRSRVRTHSGHAVFRTRRICD